MLLISNDQKQNDRLTMERGIRSSIEMARDAMSNNESIKETVRENYARAARRV